MKANDIPRLCGGIYLTLILRAVNDEFGGRDSYYKEKNETPPTERDVLGALWTIASPTYQPPKKEETSRYNSFGTTTTGYKSCRANKGAGLPDPKGNVKDEFKKRMEQSHDEMLVLMSNFTDKYLNAARNGAGLVRALLEVIEDDTTIGDDDLFWVNEDLRPLTKSELIKKKEIDLVPFILGIWYYIVEFRDRNMVGENTFKSWHVEKVVKKKGNGKDTRKNVFISDVGKNRFQDVQVKTLHYFWQKKEQGDQEDSGEKMIPLMYNLNGALPELTEDGGYIMVPVLPTEDEDDEYDERIDRYLGNLRDKYDTIKTLLYREQPKPFYDFYVCNNIERKIRLKGNRFAYTTETISNATADGLSKHSKFIIISGTGGLGKSMMMRHLLLNSIDNYDEVGKIPVFLIIKNYDPERGSLLKYVLYRINEFMPRKNQLEMDEMEEMLDEGRFLLLFDGLDELPASSRQKFEHELEKIADGFSNNTFIISSRPFSSFVSYGRFTVLELCPFRKKQALELIDKLEFREDEPSIKKAFRDKLDKELFRTHGSFTENPLLLTIMLMTFEQFAEIPSKMHIFYHEAYSALSQKHDANKSLTRKLASGLSPDRFEDYFAEFCAVTYLKSKYKFTEEEFRLFFDGLKERKKDGFKVTVSEFREDLISNICLMYPENQMLNFTHRSFQEYFCALFFSKQKDKYLEKVGRKFEQIGGNATEDKAFEMLYDMIPEKVEEYIFIPYLEELLNECDAQQGYWTFLEKMYPTFYYDNGETSESEGNYPESFLFDFITNKLVLRCVYDTYELEYYSEFKTREYVFVDASNYPGYEGDEGVIPSDDFDFDCDSGYYDEDEYYYPIEEPETVGYNCEAEIKTLVANPERYKVIMKQMEDENFPFMRQYTAIREYYNELKDKQDTEGLDLYDLFE